MANKRISTLDDITSVGGTSTAEVNANDILPITDVDDTTGSPQGTTKGVKVSDLMGEAAVQSVNTQTGAVVLDADDVDDSSTTHKFVTASDITNLGNLSGTNTGDQDLSSYQLQPTEGAFVDGDKTKLDGLDSADYATAAQGTLADSALQSLSAGALSDFDFDDNAILGFSASLPTEITASTYTVQDSDNGQVLRVNNSSGCTITIPSGLLSTNSTGFNCSFIQVGTGQITFANDGTSVINNRQSHTKTNAQWAAASTVSVANNVFVLAGDTAS